MSHNWLALTAQESLYNCHILVDNSSRREKRKLLEFCIFVHKGLRVGDWGERLHLLTDTGNSDNDPDSDE